MNGFFSLSDDGHLDLLILRQLFHLRYESLVLQNNMDFDEAVKKNVYSVCSENQDMRSLYIDDMEIFFMNLELSAKDEASVAKMLSMNIKHDAMRTALRLKFENICSKISNKLKTIQDQPLQLLLIKNYIEYILHGVLGADYIIPFLQFCCDDIGN